MWIIQKILKTNSKRNQSWILWPRSIYLFTVVVYIKEGDVVCKNYVLVTPENDNSCNISFGLNNFMISQICSDYNIHTVKFWSNDCASQFCSQYAFYMLFKFDTKIDLQWNYFEANHGKGVVDRIGEIVKHAVYSHVLTKQVAIKLPREFADYANSFSPRITVQYVENDSVVLDHHYECREKAIFSTLKVYYVEITVSKFSCKFSFFTTYQPKEALKEIEYAISCVPFSLVEGNYYLVNFEGELWPRQLIKPIKQNLE